MNALEWDSIAPVWDSLLEDGTAWPNHHGAFERFERFMRSQLNHDGRTVSSHLLDLACGTGEASRPLWKHVSSVTFMDRSPDMLKLARKKWKKGVCVRGDATDSFCHDMTFGVVISRGMLLSLLDSTSISTFFKNIDRVIRPKGRFLFDFACQKNFPDGMSFQNIWTQQQMGVLLRKHLPRFSILAYDGAATHAVNRILICKK